MRSVEVQTVDISFEICLMIYHRLSALNCIRVLVQYVVRTYVVSGSVKKILLKFLRTTVVASRRTSFRAILAKSSKFRHFCAVRIIARIILNFTEIVRKMAFVLRKKVLAIQISLPIIKSKICLRRHFKSKSKQNISNQWCRTSYQKNIIQMKMNSIIISSSEMFTKLHFK